MYLLKYKKGVVYEMSLLNEELYNFILQNKANMTEAWFANQLVEDPTFIFATSEEYVKKENGALIEAVASIHIQEEKAYKEYIKKRAFKVAEKRAEESFPIYESIQGFSNARKVYWEFVQKFIKHMERNITAEDVANWSNSMNTAFDYIIQSFAKHHYEHTQHMITYQRATILELSSPVIPIREGIGVLPLIGSIDFERANVILESTLAQCAEKQLSVIFIDLSAVPILDTMVAQKLYQLLTALKLIGVDSIFSGIRPELAQTAITLEADFSHVKTYSTLSHALKAHSY